MKMVDITKATSKYDTCAIFEVARGQSNWKRYARLLTDEEKNQPAKVSYRRTAPSVTIVYVNAIHADGQKSGSPSAYSEKAVTNFVDQIDHYGGISKENVPLARLKRCVNETQSFVDFYNAAIVARKLAAERQKQADERDKQAAINHGNRINYLNERITELGFGDRRSVSSVYGSYNREVRISIETLTELVETLTELVRPADKARMTEKAGA